MSFSQAVNKPRTIFVTSSDHTLKHGSYIHNIPRDIATTSAGDVKEANPQTVVDIGQTSVKSREKVNPQAVMDIGQTSVKSRENVNSQAVMDIGQTSVKSREKVNPQAVMDIGQTSVMSREKVNPQVVMDIGQTSVKSRKKNLNKIKTIFVTGAENTPEPYEFDAKHQRSPMTITTTAGEDYKKVTSSGNTSEPHKSAVKHQCSPGLIATTAGIDKNANPHAVIDIGQTAVNIKNKNLNKVKTIFVTSSEHTFQQRGSNADNELNRSDSNKVKTIFVTSSGNTSEPHESPVNHQRSPGIIATTPGEGIQPTRPQTMTEIGQIAVNSRKKNKVKKIFVTSSGHTLQQHRFDVANELSPTPAEIKQISPKTMMDMIQTADNKHVYTRSKATKDGTPDLNSIKQVRSLTITSYNVENKTRLLQAEDDDVTLQDLEDDYAASVGTVNNTNAEEYARSQNQESNVDYDKAQTGKGTNKISKIKTLADINKDDRKNKTLSNELNTDVDKDGQSEQEDNEAIETITLPKNINLTYSRYNGKKKTTKKNTKPGRTSMDGNEKGKTKNKQSKNFLVEQDEESYHIVMVGHMSQTAITDAFSGTGNIKQTIKKENKAEILARLKKGSIYKLFHKPTKVKKFKVKKEKTEDNQNKPNTFKGIRKSVQQFIDHIRDAFRGCGCF